MVCQMGVANIKHRKATVKHGRCVFGAPPQHTLEADMQSKLKHSKGRFRHKRKKNTRWHAATTSNKKQGAMSSS